MDTVEEDCKVLRTRNWRSLAAVEVAGKNLFRRHWPTLGWRAMNEDDFNKMEILKTKGVKID